LPRNRQYQPSVARITSLYTQSRCESSPVSEAAAAEPQAPQWLEGDTCFFENREYRIVTLQERRRLACIRPRNTLKSSNMLWVAVSELKTLPLKLSMLPHPTIFDVVERTGDTLQHWEPSLTPTATDAQPGSAEKIAVLQARLEQGEALWHQDDRQCDWQIFQRLAAKLSTLSALE
jgi:hypothetical protein